MLRLLFAVVGNLLLLLLLPLRLLRRARAAPRGAWVEIEIDGSIVEVPRRLPFWSAPRHGVALESVRRFVRLVAADPRVAGVLFTIKHVRAGTATATSLRETLASVRAAGKRVAAHLPNGGGTRETYVASAADIVIVGAETHLSPLGFSVEAHYFRELLDKIGVEPDVLARGRYKTAGEPLTERRMSDAQAEQLAALLDVAWSTLLTALVEGRNVDPERARRWVDEGPWSATSAVDEGLCDAVAYPDGVAKKLEPEKKDGARIVPAGRYAKRRRIRWVRMRRKPRIGVIEVLGPIVSTESLSLVPLAVEKAVVEAADRAREDPSVRGVVVHVDSRGGSALASDRMLHAIERLAEEKPVVAYMGDAAASGGYMVAVGTQAIVAQPTTVTGSIGVVAARFVLTPLLERLGIGVEVVKRGERADMMTSARRLSEGERAALEKQIDDVYRSFLSAVARGRDKSPEEIEPLAGGRVWSGKDAHERGLVDRLGGFDAALDELRKRIGAGAERLEPSIVAPPRMRPPSGLLPRIVRSWLLELGAPAALRGRGLVDLALLAEGETREPAWAWSPYVLSDLGDR